MRNQHLSPRRIPRDQYAARKLRARIEGIVACLEAGLEPRCSGTERIMAEGIIREKHIKKEQA